MRLAYANAEYVPNYPSGGTAHVGEFVRNAVALGHETWMWPSNPHPAARVFSSSFFARLSELRRMDVMYVRVEYKPPREGPGRWSFPPYRKLLGTTTIVWELHAPPEAASVLENDPDKAETIIEEFKQTSRYCDLVVCGSNALADYVRSRFSFPHITVVPNGSDPERFHPDAAPVKRVWRSLDHLNVVWIGSGDLSWHKLDLLRDAAQLLWESGHGDQVAFHILGRLGGPMHEMPPNVHYHGQDDYEAMPHWLAAMDVGLLLNRPGPYDFGSPSKLFDYMAAGLTVIATKNHRQACEIFKNLGQTDLLVPADDATVLADLLMNLAKNRERVRHQGAAARQLVIEFYNWRRAVQDTFTAIAAVHTV